MLRGRTPVALTDLMLWAKWMEKADRKVARTAINAVSISTVFLGLDHGFSMNDEHVPLLFETMIFGGEHDEYQERYATWDEAVAGHQFAVDMIRRTSIKLVGKTAS
jgi:hypothetical protein